MVLRTNIVEVDEKGCMVVVFDGTKKKEGIQILKVENCCFNPVNRI